MHRAVFLDRDGVINATVWNAAERIVDTPYRLEEFAILPGVPGAIRRCQELGYLTVVVSNQPGYAKGKCGPEYLDQVDALMRKLLEDEGVRLDGAYYCTHHPEAVVPELRVTCDCRKPAPGLLLRAARELDIDLRESWMAGDQERDVLAGAAAGCRTALVGAEPAARTIATLEAPDLAGAVERLAALESSSRAPAR